MRNKRVVLGLILFLLGCFVTVNKVKAAPNLAINSLNGKIFQDSNKDGIYNFEKFEIGIKDQTVELFNTLEEAANSSNSIQTVKSNYLGNYNFSRLKKGDYFVKYASNTEKYQLPSNESSQIIPVSVNSINATLNLPLNLSASFNVVPFFDTNWNGVKEVDEEIIKNKSFIIFNIEKLKTAIDENTFGSIDTDSLIKDVIKTGNFDLADGVYIRTSDSDEGIKIKNADSGIYITMRSPVNFTLTDALQNYDKLELLIKILTNGDFESLLNDPSALEGSDINTNDSSKGITLFTDAINGLLGFVEQTNLDPTLTNEKTKTVLDTATKVTQLLRSIPAYKIGMVDYTGNTYDLTGMKVKKTDTYYFGIREYAKATINIYSDKNSNGKQDLLELSSYATTINLLNEFGEVLETGNTTSKSGQVTFSRVPFNTNLYIEVIADRPVTSTLKRHELPENLKDYSITANLNVDSYSLDTSFTQKIGVIGSTSVSTDIKTSILDENIIKIENMNKKNGYSLLIYANYNDEPIELNISKKSEILLDLEESVSEYHTFINTNSYLIKID